jgi:hypothetical protein
MGYYVRAFCKSASVPPLVEVEASLRRTLPFVRFDTDDPRDSVRWRKAEFFYDEMKSPIVVEVSVDEGPESLLQAERQEFIDELSELDESEATARVIEHLRGAIYIVSCQLLSDIDDGGYEANGQLLDYFVANHDGLIQADGEGFYEGSELTVELK